jgi:hypothetical protein
VAAKHPQAKAIAIGHAMGKLLHLVFALWKRDQPFAANHYPWAGPAAASATQEPLAPDDAGPAIPSSAKQAAGHKPPAPEARPVVRAACAARVAGGEVIEQTFVDFAQLKQQLSMARVLEHLGWWSRMRGGGSQYRGPCLIHQGDARGRSFSVSLEQEVFHCFDARCGKQGEVIDLWAEVHQLSLRAAALDLEPAVR